MKLTKEQAVAYFNEKAPKALKEQGIQTIKGYSIHRAIHPHGQDEWIKVFIINDCYMIRYMTPQAYNCLMRNQNFKTVISGVKLSKKECAGMIAYWMRCCKGIVEEDQ